MTATICIRPSDPGYPSVLRAALEEELPLYVRGALPLLPGVAIVGTRDASEAALAMARRLSAALAGAGYAIWSGGARGIDGAAHEAALDAGGVTVAVLGGGFDHPFPEEHAPLFERAVAQGGALVGHQPPDQPACRGAFLVRNRTLAAMTVATVVVEAPLRSGARSTACAARRLGRPVCVVPHAPWEPRGAGCAHELSLGSFAVGSAEHVVEAITGEALATSPVRLRRARGQRPLPFDRAPAGGDPGRARSLAAPGRAGAPRTPPSPPEVLPELDPDERAVLSALGSAPCHIEEVCEKANVSFQGATLALLTLTLHTVVVEGPAGFFRRVSRP